MIFKKNNKQFSSSIDYIIVGLGNPDKKYDITRHNTGFIVLDHIADRCDCKLDKIKF